MNIYTSTVRPIIWYNKKISMHELEFSVFKNQLCVCVCVSTDDQSQYLMMANAKEQRVSGKSGDGGRRRERGELCRDVKGRNVNKTKRERVRQ